MSRCAASDVMTPALEKNDACGGCELREWAKWTTNGHESYAPNHSLSDCYCTRTTSREGRCPRAVLTYLSGIYRRDDISLQ